MYICIYVMMILGDCVYYMTCSMYGATGYLSMHICADMRCLYHISCIIMSHSLLGILSLLLVKLAGYPTVQSINRSS